MALLKNKYFKWGLAVFCTVAAILLAYDTFFGSRRLPAFFDHLVSAASPILYGAFMAYLLAPVVNFFERRVHPHKPVKRFKNGRPVSFGTRLFTITLTWVLIGALLYLLGMVLLPELYKSILQLIANIEAYYTRVSGWIQHFFETYPVMEEWVGESMESYYLNLKDFVKNDLLPRAGLLMTAFTGGVFGVVGVLGDLLVGIIVSFYFLASKEMCLAHARKVLYALFTERKVHWIVRGGRKVDYIFSGFVRGKLLDSLIICMLCFIGCSILKFPYTPLVSVVVGVTNVIPFFGPFLGAIPSVILIFLASPIKAVYFLIFILALQQLDGNVIGPKILGDKTGLSSLWVIVAILIGGGFFGFMGMFFGVPVCACLYSLFTFWMKRRLARRGLPMESEAYLEKAHVIEHVGIHWVPEEEKVPTEEPSSGADA